MKYFIFAVAMCLVAGSSLAQDPVQTDPDKYKTVFENERVRILEYIDMPGEKTLRHQHPDSVIYALSPFRRKLTLGDEKIVVVEKNVGEVYWVPEQEHIGENIGATDTHVLIVELKQTPAK